MPLTMFRQKRTVVTRFIHSFVVFKKKVDYNGPSTVSLSNDDAGAPVL